MRCKNYAQARISAVYRPLMSLLSVHALSVVNALTRWLKSTARSRAVQIFHRGCISVCLLDSNCRSLFGFFQITEVSNSNPAFELFKFSNQAFHPCQLFTLVVTADCACSWWCESFYSFRSVGCFTHCMRLHCGDVQKPKPKNRTGYLRFKTEPNRTEFEKSEPTQP